MTEQIPAPPPRHEGHAWIVAEFLDWLDGGPLPATNLEDNMRTAGMIFGALEAARAGQVVDVERMLNDVMAPERRFEEPSRSLP